MVKHSEGLSVMDILAYLPDKMWLFLDCKMIRGVGEMKQDFILCPSAK